MATSRNEATETKWKDEDVAVSVVRRADPDPLLRFLNAVRWDGDNQLCVMFRRIFSCLFAAYTHSEPYIITNC